MTWAGQFGKILVGGQWLASTSGDVLQVVNPATEDVVATTPSASREDVDRAVAAARQAFEGGPWVRATLEHRLEVLTRFRVLFAAAMPEMARLITCEMGCPSRFAEAWQTAAPLAILDSYLAVASTYPFREVRRAASGSALVSKEPVGVVAAVIPWNVPQSVLMMKLPPALITGCSLIIKPSPETPLDSYLTAELLLEAGVPEGVVSVLPADREVSEYLVSHPGVDKVTFTGSTAVGRRIAGIAGQSLKRVTLELGGKSAGILLDDADFEDSVEKLRVLSLRNSGQICTLKTRLLVSEKRQPELLERLAALVETMPVGDPLDPEVQIGPMVTERHRERVESYVASGIAQGASVVLGGGRPEHERGWYVEPTVFAGVAPDMRIAQEEIFGPVLAVMSYEDEDHAVRIANDTSYGLSGAVFTTDLDHGLRLAGRIHSGSVEINGAPVGFSSPIGGWKSSGLGRESGPEGFDAYVEPRAIGLPAGTAEDLVPLTSRIAFEVPAGLG